MEKQGVELIKKIINVVVKDIKLGQVIAKDGIDASDIQHLDEVIASIKDIIELAGQSQEIVAEAKDIDASEVGVLLMAAWSAYKEVKAE